MAASWKPDPAFVARFTRRQELFIASLRAAAAMLDSVRCRPIGGDFTFGWVFEQGHTGHPLEPEGNVEYAVNYLRHMTGQGFRVAYAVSLADGGTVHLQAWESPQRQKPWPNDPEIVFTAVWHPMSISSEHYKESAASDTRPPALSEAEGS